MKQKLINVQIILICLLGCYPLLKFNFSSLIFIVFSVFSTFLGIKYRLFDFSKNNFFRFLKFTGFTVLLVLSTTYSQNVDKALQRSLQLLPLVIAPFFIVFYNFKLKHKIKSIGLKTFLIVNLGFTVIITLVFLLNYNKANLSLFQYLLDYDKFQFVIGKSIKNDLFFIHKAYFSMGFIICAIYALDKFIDYEFEKSKWSRVYFVAFIYFFLWVFYAFSFPNIVAFSICILVLLYFKLGLKKIIKPALVFLTVSLVLVFVKLNDIDVQRGFNFMKSTVDEQEYEVNDVRKEIYNSHWDLLKRANTKELAFGLGLGDVQDLLNDNYEERYERRNITNLLFFNEEFDQLYWFKNNIKTKSNATTSPDGDRTADLLTHDDIDSIASYSISRNIDLEKNKRYTFSVFAKAGETEFLILRLGKIHQRAIFNLKEGIILDSVNVDSAFIKKIKDGWYRCAIVVNNINTNPLALIGLSNSAGDYHFTTPESGLYLWGAQLEKGQLSTYSKNGSELLNKAIERKFNSHNYYLYIVLSIGIVGFLAFLIFLTTIFRDAIIQKDHLKIVFCILLALNFLTENILVRQWGLMFFAFMFLILFSENKEEKFFE